ncbi:DUF7322 domain-containing protein [Halorussus amylolyticus]|uniref:DUF7322 domain-containing protein n=1 Tax=Halorussus amylolyticus TaxID=1126242 RepID=UPI0010464B55|nr:hypothetical protein [Halorussus amylolyticus]
MFLDPFPPEGEDDVADLQGKVQEISQDTLRRFIVVAVLVQAGLFAGSLGAMLVAFRGQRTVGGALVVGGTVSLGVALAVYRRR